MKVRSVSRPLMSAIAATALLLPLATTAQPGSGMMEPGMPMMGHHSYGMGMGPGMMGGGMGMGPGMMMGRGMMGMGGMGMMGLHGLDLLDLTDQQRDKINGIHDKLRKQHWEIMGQMMDQHTALRDLYEAEPLDAKKIGAAYDQVFKLKRQMIDTAIQAHNDTTAVLTKEQRAQLKQLRRGRGTMGPGAGSRGPMGPGGMMGPGMMGR